MIWTAKAKTCLKHACLLWDVHMDLTETPEGSKIDVHADLTEILEGGKTDVEVLDCNENEPVKQPKFLGERRAGSSVFAKM